jgi:hypothetical protein
MMYSKIAVITILTLAWLVGGCGTYSLLRGADNLKQGQLEMTGGVALNSIPETVGVVQLAVGLTDSIELGAQYEQYSALGHLRYGLFNSEDHGIALALSLGGGASSIKFDLDEDLEALEQVAITAGLTLGRRWDWFELYLGYRSLFLVPDQYSINTVKMGARATLFDHLVVGIEGGATFHHNFMVLGEGAAHIGFVL